MSYRFRILVFLLIAACGGAAPAFAQERDGARISGFYGGAIGEGATNVGAGGSVGYRFTPRIGFDFEVLALPDFEIERSGASGRGVAFLTNFVTEFPSPAAWLTPYVQGGGGVANISQSSNFDSDLANRDVRRLPIRARGGPGPWHGGAEALPANLRRAETSLALTVGGGVDFALWRGLSVGPTLSYLKLFGSSQDLDLTRVGARASYRF